MISIPYHTTTGNKIYKVSGFNDSSYFIKEQYGGCWNVAFYTNSPFVHITEISHSLSDNKIDFFTDTTKTNALYLVLGAYCPMSIVGVGPNVTYQGEVSIDTSTLYHIPKDIVSGMTLSELKAALSNV